MPHEKIPQKSNPFIVRFFSGLFYYARLFYLTSYGPHLNGYSHKVWFFPVCLMFLIVYGPNLVRGEYEFILLIVCEFLLGIAIYCSLKKKNKIDKLKTSYKLFFGVMETQLIIILIAAIFVFYFLLTNENRYGKEMYRQVITWPIYLIFIFIPLFIAKYFLSKKLFHKNESSGSLRSILEKVDLNYRQEKNYYIKKIDFLYIMFETIIRYPLFILFMPSLYVLLFSLLPIFYYQITVLIALVTWVSLSLLIYYGKFDPVFYFFKRWFFHGGSLIVSSIIIILAIGRLFSISYIETPMTHETWITITIYIFCIYMLFWYIEYWVNRILCDKIMDFIRKDDDQPGMIEYQILNNHIGEKKRKIYIYDDVRFSSIWKQENGKKDKIIKFEATDLFKSIINYGCMALAKGFVKKHDFENAKAVSKEIQNHIRIYFNTIFLLYAIIIFSFLLYLHFFSEQKAALEYSKQEKSETDSRPVKRSTLTYFKEKNNNAELKLEDLLWEKNDNSAIDSKHIRKVILFAASGGGTRAALHTMAVLRGLHNIKAINYLKLGSGVSGGGVALTYYASHQKKLSESDQINLEWIQYALDMSYPFIHDVMKGIFEWRIIAGSRLSELLKESFDRVFYKKFDDNIKKFSDVKDLGLILNSSITGHLDCSQIKNTESSKSFQSIALTYRKYTQKNESGGILIFTNLNGLEFLEENANKKYLKFPYKVIVPKKEKDLTIAAALTSNFPPVFSDSAVDIDNKYRYWVTDGGVTDNKGLITLLLVLKNEIEKLKEPLKNPPEIYIVVADASAESTKYSVTRGIDPALSASEKISNLTAEQLLKSIKNSYSAKTCQKGIIEEFYIGMPDFLRVDGGIGTHWMLPLMIKLERKSDSIEPLTIDFLGAMDLILDLYNIKLDRSQYTTPEINYYFTKLIDKKLDEMLLSSDYRYKFIDKAVRKIAENSFEKRQRNINKIIEWLKTDNYYAEWIKLQNKLEKMPNNNNYFERHK